VSWEERCHKTFYYSVSKKMGRYTKRYWGRGENAQRAIDALQTKRLNGDVQSAERLLLKHLGEPFETFTRLVRTLYRASLLAAGYWQRSRFAWLRTGDDHEIRKPRD